VEHILRCVVWPDATQIGAKLLECLRLILDQSDMNKDLSPLLWEYLSAAE
jgi:hypothetical protein